MDTDRILGRLLAHASRPSCDRLRLRALFAARMDTSPSVTLRLTFPAGRCSLRLVDNGSGSRYWYLDASRRGRRARVFCCAEDDITGSQVRECADTLFSQLPDNVT